MKGTQPTSAQAPNFFLEDLVSGFAEALRNGADIDGLEFAALEPSRVALRDATVVGCRFDETVSTDVDLCGAAVRETEFERPDITVVQAWRGRWSDVRVRGGRLGVFEAYASEWNAVEMKGCKISFLNLRGSEVSDLVLHDCQIEELDLDEAVLRRASLDGSHVQRLNVRGARMHAVDLRGATYDEITGVENLRGAIVTRAQLMELAPLLAQEVGIVIED